MHWQSSILAAVLFLAGTAFAAPVITSATNTFVFEHGAPISFSVGAVPTGATWTVRAYEGPVVGSGRVEPGALPQALALPPLPIGYYIVSVAPVDGAAAAVETPLAILAPNERQAPRPRFGVMTHYAHNWNTDSVPLVDLPNMGFVRDELYWKAIELTRGVYTFPEQYDRYMRELRPRGISPLIVLSFENPLYDNGDTPYTDEAIAAFAKYAVAVLRHYGQQIKSVEVWNEYNGTFCTGPAANDRTGNYMRLLRATYQAIKRVRPDVGVLGGATAGVPLPYWEKLCQAGALRFMDGVSVHPYRYTDQPEGIGDDIVELDRLVARYNKGATKPIWVTEFGWIIREPAAPGDLAVGEPEKAKYLARGATLLLAAGVERLCWYLLKDDWDPMGLVSADAPYAPKPAYAAYATFIRMLDGAQFVRREASAAHVHSYLFRRDTVDIRVMWATSPTDVLLKGRRPLMAVNLVGGDVELPAGGDGLPLRLTDAPVYIAGAQVRPALPPLLESDRLITDAAVDFSATQGKDGWSFGHSGAPGEFTPLTQCRTNDWRAEWGNEVPFLSVTARTHHPAFSNGQVRQAVRRWVSTVSGTVRIAGSWRGLTQGDGTEASILVDGVERFKAQVGGGASIRVPFDLTADVRPGTTIDFLLGPRNDMNHDETELSVRITGAAGRTE